MPREATCIRCGCTDSQPCPGGCAWIYVDPCTGKGVCTSCSPLASVADGVPGVDEDTPDLNFMEEEELVLAGTLEDALEFTGEEVPDAD